jgi:hypothetical protein
VSRISGGTVWWKSPSTGLARGSAGKPAGPTQPGMTGVEREQTALADCLEGYLEIIGKPAKFLVRNLVEKLRRDLYQFASRTEPLPEIC